eukprot:UN04287
MCMYLCNNQFFFCFFYYYLFIFPLFFTKTSFVSSIIYDIITFYNILNLYHLFYELSYLIIYYYIYFINKI